MKPYWLSVSILITIFLPSSALSQYTCEPTDSSYSEFVTCANNHLEETKYYDPLQRRYANEFYTFYTAYPDSVHAQEVFLDALVMWINLSEFEKIETALSGIDLQSEIWNDVVPALIYSNIFKRLYGDRYINWLKSISETLTNPESLTIILVELATQYRMKGEEEKMLEQYRKVDRLNADTAYAEMIRSFLYDYDVLGSGMKAPDFELTSIGGENISLKEKEGKVILLIFWDKFCATFCQNQAREIQKWKINNSTKELETIWISVETDGEKMVELLEQFELKPPQIWLPEGENHAVAKAYNVKKGSRTIIIDNNGRIVGKDLWFDDLEKSLVSILEEKK